MVDCPKCGCVLDNPFDMENLARLDIVKCPNGCDISENTDKLNETALCEVISNILNNKNIDSGHNLFNLYKVLRDSSVRNIETSSGNRYQTRRLQDQIKSIAEYLIIGDIGSADTTTRTIPNSENGLNKKVRKLRRKDKNAFYNNSRPFPPWNKVINKSDIMDDPVQKNNSSNKNTIFGKFTDIDIDDEEPDEPIVEIKKYRGHDIKIIGTLHLSHNMIDRIKEELKGCQLVLVESGRGNEFRPESGIGLQAADEYRNYVGVDVVRVLKGRAEPPHPDLDESRSQDIVDRRDELVEDRRNETELFDKTITDRNMRFVLEAIKHINEYAQTHTYPSRVAVVVGKDHAPGIAQYFGKL